jgi:hypothetical protein
LYSSGFLTKSTVLKVAKKKQEIIKIIKIRIGIIGVILVILIEVKNLAFCLYINIAKGTNTSIMDNGNKKKIRLNQPKINEFTTDSSKPKPNQRAKFSAKLNACFLKISLLIKNPSIKRKTIGRYTVTTKFA